MTTKKVLLNFPLSASRDAHTALRARSRMAINALSLSLNKERAKENQPRRSPLDPPTARRFDDERRGFLRQQTSSICGAYISPRRWVSRARFLAIAGGADALDSSPIRSFSPVETLRKSTVDFPKPFTFGSFMI